MSDYPRLHRIFVKLLLRLPTRLSLAIIAHLPVNSQRWRYLRSQFLRQRSRELQRLMQAIDFHSTLMIEPEGDICVVTEGISLSAELTNRYFKVTSDQPGNEGHYLAGILSKQGIVPEQIIDLGANFGEISLYFSRAMPTARILAVEASPRNFGVLQRNRERQLFDTQNLSAVNCAVGDHAGEVDISVGLGSANSIITGNSNALNYEIDATEKVAVKTLSDLAGQFGVTAPDFIKIDIEGAEPLLADSLLELRARALIIEFSNKNTQEAYLYLARKLLDADYRVMTTDEKALPSFADLEAYLRKRWSAKSWGTASRGCDLWFFLSPAAGKTQ